MAALIAGLLGGVATAATVRFDVVPTDNVTATEIQVTPGSEVGYDLYAQVTSDNADTADNNGLSFFTLDVTTNLGVAQPALTQFETQIGQLFSIVQSLGTPQDDDIVQIGGGQNSFAGGNAQAGIGTGSERILIGQGRFITPDTLGTFSIGIADTSRANVFAAGSTTSASQATFLAGPGFAIVTTDTPDNDVTAAAEQTAADRALTGGILFTGLGVLLFFAAFLLLGPWAGLILVVLFPLLMLLGLVATT